MFIKYLAKNRYIKINIMTIIIKFYNSTKRFVRNLIKALGVLFSLHILRALPSSLFL